jgi:hypothetical protein
MQASGLVDVGPNCALLGSDWDLASAVRRMRGARGSTVLLQRAGAEFTLATIIGLSYECDDV